MDKYEKLKKQLPEIGKAVSALPETVQEKAFEMMVATLLEQELPRSGAPASGGVLIPQLAVGDMSGVGTKTSDGNFHFSVRDLKADSAIDAAKRLVYVLIRAYTQVMRAETVSRKKIINSHLNAWRLDNGNTRRFLANDPGIIKNGDELKLDHHATAEADVYIQRIMDPNAVGTWKPGTRKGKKKNEE